MPIPDTSLHMWATAAELSLHRGVPMTTKERMKVVAHMDWCLRRVAKQAKDDGGMNVRDAAEFIVDEMEAWSRVQDTTWPGRTKL